MKPSPAAPVHGSKHRFCVDLQAVNLLARFCDLFTLLLWVDR
jgi:hypothetical protein